MKRPHGPRACNLCLDLVPFISNVVNKENAICFLFTFAIDAIAIEKTESPPVDCGWFASQRRVMRLQTSGAHTHTISLRKYWINIIQIAIICIITCLCISFKFIFEYNRMLLCILMVLPNGSRNVNHISQFTNFESSDSRRRRRPGDWLSEYHIILFSAIFTPVHYATDINLILQRFRRKKYLIMRTTNIYLTVFSSHFGALVDAPMLFNTCFQLMLNIIIPEAGEYLRPTLARRNKFVGNIFKWIARQIRRSKGKLLIATANISLQQRTTHIGSL